MATLDAHQIELFAVNTGELYETHLHMARSGCTLAEWHYHVMTKVLPLYSKQVRGLHFATDDEKTKAAQALKDYYEEHITTF